MELSNNLKNEFIEALLQLYISNQASSIAEMLEGEHAVLSYILKEKQDVTPTNISLKLGITKSRVTAILNSLHEKELVLLKRKSDYGRSQKTFAVAVSGLWFPSESGEVVLRAMRHGGLRELWTASFGTVDRERTTV